MNPNYTVNVEINFRLLLVIISARLLLQVKFCTTLRPITISITNHYGAHLILMQGLLYVYVHEHTVELRFLKGS